MHYKTYCFAFQKRRFYTVKAAVLQCKTAAFAMSKRSYHFLTDLSLQSRRFLPEFAFSKNKKTNRFNKHRRFPFSPIRCRFVRFTFPLLPTIQRSLHGVYVGTYLQAEQLQPDSLCLKEPSRELVLQGCN